MKRVSTHKVLAWEAPEFFHRPKNLVWLVVVWTAGLFLSVLALWYYQASFFGVISALVPLAGALALTTQGRLKPELIRIVIDNDGLSIKGQAYTWDELKGFWIVYSADARILYLETVRRLLPIVSIQISKADPQAIRERLLEYLPERTDQNEDFSDRLARLLKF